jgi:hypothetical protein
VELLAEREVLTDQFVMAAAGRASVAIATVDRSPDPRPAKGAIPVGGSAADTDVGVDQVW